MIERILSTVSTQKRPGLTGLCLHNLLRNKSPDSDVIICDDNSTQMNAAWFTRFGLTMETAVPGRHYHAHRLLRFLESDYRFLLILDSDMLTTPRFDALILAAWEQAQQPELLATGYQSRLAKTLEVFPNYLLLSTCPGCCQFFTRPLAARAHAYLKNVSGYTHRWDILQAEGLQTCVCTGRSVVQHLGIFEGMNADKNNVSPDYSENFTGSLYVGTR